MCKHNDSYRMNTNRPIIFGVKVGKMKQFLVKYKNTIATGQRRMFCEI